MAISGRQLRFCRGFPVIRPGTARLPRPLRGLAMTRQGGTAVHQRPYAVELSRTRRSLSAATGPVGTGSILTIVCAYRQHCAGRGMPRPSAKRQSDGQFGAMHRSRRHAPLICHCEEAAGRRGNLGKAVTILPGLSCDPAGYCEIATGAKRPRNDNFWGAFTILTIACTGGRCVAGRGMPRPYFFAHIEAADKCPSPRRKQADFRGKSFKKLLHSGYFSVIIRTIYSRLY